MKAATDITSYTASYFESVLNHIEDPIIATDQEFYIRYWNKGAQKVFKYSFEEVMGKEIATVLGMLYTKEVLKEIISHLNNKGSWKGQLQYKSKSESILTFEVSVVAVKNDFSTVTGYVALYKNITEQKHTELKLKDALAKEHQLNDMKNRFVAMASHEFRTPFSAILSSSNLIERYSSTEQQANRLKHVVKIKEAIHHMNAILEDFLSLGRLEEGRTNANVFTFNLKVLVVSVIDELELIRKQGQRIHYTHEGNNEITTDKKLLKNIIINLLSNAIKFSYENQLIWIHTENKDQHKKIEVRDEGIGISAEDQLHLFESFYRGKNVQSVEGTGLGLHIAKRYANLLNGELTINSQPGKGTVAIFTM